MTTAPPSAPSPTASSPSSLAVGARRLAQTCRALEEAVKHADTAALIRNAREFRSVRLATRQQIERQLADNGRHACRQHR